MKRRHGCSTGRSVQSAAASHAVVELLRSRLKRRGMEVSPAVLSAYWLAGTPTGVTLPPDRIHRRRRDRVRGGAEPFRLP